MDKNNEVWIWVEQRNEKIMEVSLQVLGKGLELSKELNRKLSAIVIGDNIEGFAKEVISYGADKVYTISDPQLKYYESSAYTRMISELVEEHKPEIMLFGASSIGMDLASAVAARTNTGLTAHCNELYINTIDGKQQLVTTVPGFSGGMIVKIICPEKRPQMATVSAGVAEKPEKDETRQGDIIKVAYKATEGDLKIRTIEIVEGEPTCMLVEDSKVVISGGKGMKTEGVRLVEELAQILGAAIGGTRPVIDAGWVPEDNLIGSSGKTISPKLFFSIGAHGASHYTSGFGKAECVLAIDKDPKSPIFDSCDLGIVADLNEILPYLIEELRAIT